MNKFDPHKHDKYYKQWKERGCKFKGTTEENKALLMRFLEDMEIGANVNPESKKGGRSSARLRNLKSKMQTLSYLMHRELGIKTLEELEHRELDLLRFFKKLKDGAIVLDHHGHKPLTAVGTYVKTLKSFWHWFQRSQKKNGIEVRDVTVDLDGTDLKPKFNYMTIEQVKLLCNEVSYYYKVLMMFLFDSGIRAPTELMNVKAGDLEWDEKQGHYTLNIRQETSKTFGRRIKLLLSSDIVKEYIQKQKLSNQEFLFKKTHQKMNQYLKNYGFKVLKIGFVENKTFEGRSYQVVRDGISMYDFRHSSACYWLVRYKSESALKYRFGWKKSEMIHYYTELLGMKDTIQDEDLYIDVSKTELERQIQEKGREIEIMQERLQDQDNKMKEMMQILKALQLESMIQVQ
jgi:integrase